MIKIEVTQQHIDDGKPKMTAYCPVALACQSTLGAVIVGKTDIIRVGNDWKDKRIPLPDYAREWVKSCDNGELVQPFTLIIEDAQ